MVNAWDRHQNYYQGPSELKVLHGKRFRTGIFSIFSLEKSYLNTRLRHDGSVKAELDPKFHGICDNKN